MQLGELLQLTKDLAASDLHLRIGSPPILRIQGVLTKQLDSPPMTKEEINATFESITTPAQREAFFNDHELDFCHSVPGLARFRVSVLRQRGTLSLAFRIIPFNVPSIDDFELPPIYKELALKPRGLILVTGPTGSGKSTTMAGMVNHLNNNEARNIITIEHPIEFLHNDKLCVIVQREVGDDTHSFDKALVHALRHDPDVIVVGEMRDLHTIGAAITAAETGHLVLGTLHTTDAAQTVDRIIDVFPEGQQQQIRLQLSQVIEAVLSQCLLPRISGGRVAACEIMIANTAVRNLIRDGQSYKLPSVMQMSGKEGMQTLDQALADLVSKHVVTEEEAFKKSSKPEQLNNLIHGSAGGYKNGSGHAADLYFADNKIPV